MSESEEKKIFQKNLNNLISTSGKSQKEVADAIGVSPQTFNTWMQGIAIPRMGKIQLLADYFSISKSDLIEERTQPAAPSSFRLSDFEKELVVAYRRTDEAIKTSVRKLLDIDDAELPKKEKAV